MPLKRRIAELEAEVAKLRNAMIQTLAAQSLADHLGDIRDDEERLWHALEVPLLPYGHPANDYESVFKITRARLQEAGLDVPEHLRNDDDDDE